ncbi:MAG: hypothetical protein ACT4PT_09050 [Methanobacteriota archaeon]
MNKHLPGGTRAVLVGGALVEFYTAGAYTTGDLDLIGDRDAAATLLLAAGFRADRRYFVHDRYELAVELPKDRLRKTETVVELDFEGYRIPAVTVEDAIVDRLLAAKFWKSQTDWEQAILLYAAHRTRLDRDALAKKAAPNEVGDILTELVETVERAPD